MIDILVSVIVLISAIAIVASTFVLLFRCIIGRNNGNPAGTGGRWGADLLYTTPSGEKFKGEKTMIKNFLDDESEGVGATVKAGLEAEFAEYKRWSDNFNLDEKEKTLTDLPPVQSVEDTGSDLRLSFIQTLMAEYGRSSTTLHKLCTSEAVNSPEVIGLLVEYQVGLREDISRLIGMEPVLVSSEEPNK